MNGKSGIRVACFGLNEQELSIVQSLVRIVDGRKKIAWSLERSCDSANVIIILATVPGAEKLLFEKGHLPQLRVILIRPEGTFPPPAHLKICTIRHPLRATELLETFDKIENEWPFDNAGNAASAQESTRETAQGVAHDVLQNYRSTPSSSPPPKPPAAAPLPPLQAKPPATPPKSPVAASLPPFPAKSSVAAPLPPLQAKPPATPPTSPVAASLPPLPPKSSAAPSPPSPPISSATAKTPVPSAIVTPPSQVKQPLPSTGVAPLQNKSGASAASILADHMVTSATPRPRISVTEAATIGQLIAALQLLNSPLGAQRFIDLSDANGWFARIRGSTEKAIASSRFVLNKAKLHTSPDSDAVFRWQYVKNNTRPHIASNDALISIDLDILSWQIAHRFCRSLAKLDLPEEKKLHLTRWPDFGILPDFPNRSGVMLATALLARRHITVQEIIEESGIGESDLACLLAACWLCGWLQQTIKNPLIEDFQSTSFETKKKEKTFSAIVRSLRRVLGLSSARGR
ncbi:MAG: hypothetical protein LBS40_00750 [Burkholderiales bacterium]|jgi:hypothetical protein|nr:hypothetical protein [Burkholderiales bacterium]